jgi:putative ABC transport system permease protein
MLQHMTVDLPVLAFTLGISIVTGLLFGLVPAWRSSRTDLNTTLKEAAGRSEGGGGSHRIRSFLLASEVALAVLLSVSAGLLLRSFVRVMGVDPGVRTANILTMNLSLAESRYDTPLKRAAFYKSVTERLERLPGVRSAGGVMFLPLRVSLLSFRVGVNSFTIQGRPPVPQDQRPQADYRVATPGYFSTMGIALLQGRLLDSHDDLNARRVALINETMVRKHFAHENPIGQHLLMGEPVEIVGVVADAKMYGLDTPVEPAVYVPHEQHPAASMGVAVRTEGDPAAMAPAVRQEILKLDAEQPISSVRTMQEVLSDSLMLRRATMLMLTVFALLALTLATLGIYGLTAYSVSRRTHEIGLRVALGASRPQILRLVVGRELVTSMIGAAIGVGAAFIMTRGLSAMLYDVTATDPLVFVCMPLMLIAVSVIASYVPARKATKIDPLVALRYE